MLLAVETAGSIKSLSLEWMLVYDRHNTTEDSRQRAELPELRIRRAFEASEFSKMLIVETKCGTHLSKQNKLL